MAVVWQSRTGRWDANAKERVARRAGRQQGRITSAQLRLIGVGRTTVARWLDAGYLHPRLPRVYAVGHPGRTTESDLFEAVLYAGPDAMLSHMSAAWWLGLIAFGPGVIHVSTPRRPRSLPGAVVVHGRRDLHRAVHRDIPVTTRNQTVLDLAAIDERRLVRKALAQLDYEHRLDLQALDAICRHGRPGSRLLTWAIAAHDPLFARTRSPLEDDWLIFCERTDIPKPDAVNERVHGIRSDNIYRDARLIVETDGGDNHHSAAQMRRDHANDLTLRSHGWQVLRYSWPQVHHNPDGVRDDVLKALTARVSG